MDYVVRNAGMMRLLLERAQESHRTGAGWQRSIGFGAVMESVSAWKMAASLSPDKQLHFAIFFSNARECAAASLHLPHKSLQASTYDFSRAVVVALEAANSAAFLSASLPVGVSPLSHRPW